RPRGQRTQGRGRRAGSGSDHQRPLKRQARRADESSGAATWAPAVAPSPCNAAATIATTAGSGAGRGRSPAPAGPVAVPVSVSVSVRA
ncbi:MAG: hypothetical protein ACRDWE_09285, partial [Acidimicrobiales bacterium]